MQATTLRPDSLYFLRRDVLFQRPADLLGASRAFDCHESEWVLSCPNIRARSKIISERIYQLLTSFQSGSKVSTAIVALAKREGSEPRELLQSYLPVLQDLLRWGYLSLSNEPVEALGETGSLPEALPGYLTLRVLKASAALLVLQAQSMDGETVCIKRLSGEESPIERRKIVNEAAMLEKLQGLRVPRILAFFPETPECGLVTSWVGDVSSRDAFAGALGVGAVVDSQTALRLASHILRAFVEIHARGILHSDIHYHNIRFRDNEVCNVIDFGLSFEANSPATLEPLMEAAAPFLAPEQFPLAEGDFYHRPTDASEQYSLGALLYYLLSGKHYLDFRLESGEMIRQIRETPPSPLMLRNRESIPAVEQVLRKSLSKESASRYSTLREFAGAFEDASTSHRPDAAKSSMGEAADRWPDLQRLNPDNAIRCSGDNFGIAGALNYALCALALGSTYMAPEYLDSALIWAGHARRLSRIPGALEGELARSKVRAVPFFIGATSFHKMPLVADLAIAAVACATGERLSTGQDFLDRLQTEVDQEDRWDFTTGHAALLNALCHFARHDLLAPSVGLIGQRLCERLLDRLAAISHSRPLSLPELGMAHGLGGAWYAVLQWFDSHQRPITNDLCESFGHYCAQLPVESLLRAKHPQDRASFVPWWCNGLSGIIGLLALKNAPLAPASQQDLVYSMAEIVIAQSSVINHLCCGNAGQAFALTQAYRITREDRFRRGAATAMERARLPDRGHTTDASILKGTLGISLIAKAAEPGESLLVPFLIGL